MKESLNTTSKRIEKCCREVRKFIRGRGQGLDFPIDDKHYIIIVENHKLNPIFVQAVLTGGRL
jgi:hypothetical protein